MFISVGPEPISLPSVMIYTNIFCCLFVILGGGWSSLAEIHFFIYRDNDSTQNRFRSNIVIYNDNRWETRLIWDGFIHKIEFVIFTREGTLSCSKDIWLINYVYNQPSSFTYLGMDEFIHHTGWEKAIVIRWNFYKLEPYHEDDPEYKMDLLHLFC